MSAMCAHSRLRLVATATLAVCRVSASGVADGRNDSSQHEDPADPLVLGRVSDDYRQARRLGAACSSASSGCGATKPLG